MAPATEEPKPQIDARGVLIMVVALGAIVGLWVNGKWAIAARSDPRPCRFLFKVMSRTRALAQRARCVRNNVMSASDF